MSYNPKVKFSAGRVQAIEYAPVAAASAGDVLIVNGVAYFAVADIAAGVVGEWAISGGVWAGNKSSGAWAAGDRIYYNPTGTPNVGTASSGAFNNGGTGFFVGFAVVSPETQAQAATGDQLGYFVKVEGGGAVQASSVAAAGSTQTDAAALNVGFNFVTAADGTKGAVLPAGAVGRIVYVKNSDAANAVLKIYPPTSGTINALAANGAISMALKTSAVFICLDGTAWYTIPLLPS